MKSQISLNSKRNRNRSISSESIPEEDENYMDEIIEVHPEFTTKRILFNDDNL